jgi:aminopeptidase N
MKYSYVILIIVLFCQSTFFINAQEKRDLPEHFSLIEKQENRNPQRLQQSITQNNYDLKYHRFFWFIDPAKRYISGSVTSYFTATSDLISSIQFTMSDSLSCDSVIHAGKKAITNHSGNLLTIILNHTIPLGKLDSMTVFYHGVPPKTGFGSFDNYVHNGAPSMWTLSEPYGASDWWPSKNDLTDKIDSIDVFVVMPKGNHAASNGLLVSEKPYDSNSTIDHWKHRYPIASYLVCIAVTNYARYSDYYVSGNDTLPILNYVYPEDSVAMRGATPDDVKTMALFEQLFGRYPFWKEKYGHTECNFGGGMEHQTMAFLGTKAFDHYTLGHELGHQWFGDLVTCGSWEDIWLNEGFATYSLGLSYEYLYAESTFSKYMNDNRGYIIAHPQGSVFCNDTTSVQRIFSSSFSYFKGAYLLQMIRWLIGDHDFFQSIRNYLSDPALQHSFAKTRDLKRHLEQQTGKDLTAFFNEWFYGSGVPSYSISIDQQTNLNTTIAISQTSYNSDVSFFHMKIPIEFKNATNDTIISFDHMYSGQVFECNPGFKVDSVFFDPKSKILYYQANLVLNKNLSSLNQIQSSGNSKILTNPASSMLRVEHTAGALNYIQILNPDGKTEITIPLKLEDTFLELNIENLKSGVYILKVGNSDWMETKKFIVKK